jgi:hypothetical protein
VMDQIVAALEAAPSTRSSDTQSLIERTPP